jgi:hypothetical protein
MNFPFRYRRVVVAAALTLGATCSALAEPLPAAIPETKRFEVPGGDLFGVTRPVEGGNRGSRGVAFEFAHSSDEREGGYWSAARNMRFSFMALENPADAVSPWARSVRTHDVPTLGAAAARFDGFAGEVSYRFLERGPTNPFAAAISVEPRVARIDALTGESGRAQGAEARLALDAVLSPGRLYGAFNVNYGFNTQRAFGFGEQWADSSGTTVSGAVTYQFTDRLFGGVEGRWLTSFSGALLNEQMGWAVFAGPTMQLKVSDRSALNLMWTPQLTGSLAGGKGPLDADTGERQEFRARFATSF